MTETVGEWFERGMDKALGVCRRCGAAFGGEQVGWASRTHDDSDPGWRFHLQAHPPRFVNPDRYEVRRLVVGPALSPTTSAVETDGET